MLRPQPTAGVDDAADGREGGGARAKLGLSFILNAGDAQSPPSRRRQLSTSSTDAAAADAESGLDMEDERRPGAESSKEGERRTGADSSKEDKRRGRTCKVDGCPNYIVHKGLCCRHGGGKKCSIEGCNTSAKHWGLCWKHGGSIGCKVRNCTKRAKARGLCWGHGGGTKCGNAHCDKVAVSEGLCWAHGGGKRCIRAGCRRPGYERTLNYCVKHYAELMSASEAKMEASRDGGGAAGSGSDTDLVASR